MAKTLKRADSSVSSMLSLTVTVPGMDTLYIADVQSVLRINRNTTLDEAAEAPELLGQLGLYVAAAEAELDRKKLQLAQHEAELIDSIELEGKKMTVKQTEAAITITPSYQAMKQSIIDYSEILGKATNVWKAALQRKDLIVAILNTQRRAGDSD